MSSSSTPTLTTRHTASQSLSPSHVSTDSPSPSPLQTATPIPSLPSPSAARISLLHHLQNLLDVTSTLLALFIACLLTIFFIYWSSIYILRQATGSQSNERIGFWDSLTNPSSAQEKDSTKESKEGKKEVNFATHPSDKEFTEKAKEIKQRLSGVQEGERGGQSGQGEKGTAEAGLGDRSAQEKDRVAKIAKSTGYEGLGEATGRKVEDIRAEADLEFQRGVADVRGDVEGVERRGVEGGGKSYGAL